MPQGTVGLRFNIDTSQARAQVDDLSRTIAGLNEEIRQATEEEDWRAVATLTQALNDTTSARGQTMSQARQVQNDQARENMNSGGIFAGQGAWIFQQSLNQITRGIIQSMDAALSAAKQRASGDYAGATVTGVRTRGELTGQGVGVGVGTGLGVGLTALTGQAWLIPLLAGLGGEIGKFIGGIGAKELETNLAYAAQYKNALSSIDALNQNYGGDINRNTGDENNRQGLEMYGRATAATEGTGLTTQAFIEAMKQMGGYGVKNESQALDMTHIQALWSRYTGTDLSAIQKFAGQAYRFSGDTGAVSTAYGGLMAQGMAKGQTTEFLNAMGRIMEESISKGFVRSSEEIAGNMQMLYKLSGESRLWQGEQGAQRLSQMNNAVSNATNLQSVEDVVTFGVARELLGVDDPSTPANERKARFMKYGGVGKHYTGTYADEMQLLERGVSADLLKGQFESVSKLEGNNVAGIIERFKSMYGLNYTGAAQVYKMMENAKDANGNFTFDAKKYEDQIKEMLTKPEFASDSALLQTAINKMTDNLVNIGQFKFNSTEWGMLQNQADNVAAIRGAITRERDKPDIERREAAYLPKVDAAGSATTNTIITLMADEYGPGSEGAFTYNLERLSGAAGQSKDLNNQKLGQRYNSEVFPLLETLNTNNVSKEIIDILYQLQRGHSEAVTGGEAGNKVGNNELADLNNKIDRLIEALNRNTLSTDDNTDSDKDITLTL